MDDAKQAAVALLEIQRGKLELAWKYAPYVIGGKALGLSMGNVDYGRAYIHAAGDWLAAANEVLGELDENDPDQVIDQLGAAVDLVQQRRTQLFNMGMSLADPLTDGSKDFLASVRDDIKAALAWLKKHLPTRDDIDKYGAGVIVVLALVAVIVIFK